MNAQLSQLLDREVSRQEFLGMTGLAVASIFGFGTLVKLLSGHSLGSSRHFLSGYSSGSYGGLKDAH